MSDVKELDLWEKIEKILNDRADYLISMHGSMNDPEQFNKAITTLINASISVQKRVPI
jgi:hypothetical protein